jgi:hypothetical protein
MTVELSHMTFLTRATNTFVLVKDKAEKPFALAFLPLIEKAGTVIQDGHRHLVVYRVRTAFHHRGVNASERL